MATKNTPKNALSASKFTKKTSKHSVMMSFWTILFYCLSFIILVVWASAIGAAVAGKFDPVEVYPETLTFSYESLGFEDADKARNDALRITGMTQEKKDEIIASAPQEQREDLERNIQVDRKFKVLANSDEVNMTKISLKSSDTSIATVPNEVEIGEEIEITPVQVNGVNKGGFVTITATSYLAGVYTSNALLVLVDVPVQDFEISLNGIASQTFYPTAEEYSNYDEDIISEVTGKEVYQLYEGETAQINYSVTPSNSLNPTLNSAFESKQKSNKKISYYLENDETSISVNEEGVITADKAGLYKVWAKVFKTYDDEIFVNDYKFNLWETVIEDKYLTGRYEYACLYIEVKEVVLEEILVDNNNTISINLFESLTITPDDLGIELVSNRGNNTDFENEFKLLSISSTVDSITVAKTPDKAEWTLTAVSEPNGIQLAISHPNFSEIIAYYTNVEVNVVGISSVNLYGESKITTESPYNDFVKLEITKKIEQDEESITEPDFWSYQNSIEIQSENQELSATYQTFKLFVVGAYWNGESQPDIYTNQHSQKVINCSDEIMANLGYEITDSEIRALSSGSVAVCAYILKTDINKNPIMREDGGYEIVAKSNLITITVVEKLIELNLELEIESTGDSVILNSGDLISSSKTIVVNSSGILTMKATANSVGALEDALNNDWFELETNNSEAISIEQTIIQAKNDEVNLQIQFENDTEQNQDANLYINLWQGEKFERFMSINFLVIKVAVKSITMNTNMQQDQDMAQILTIPYYNIYGSANFPTADDNKLNNNVNVVWGQYDELGTNFQQFELLTPEFEAETYSIYNDTTKYIVPKEFTVSDLSFVYSTKQSSVSGGVASIKITGDDYNDITVTSLSQNADGTLEGVVDLILTAGGKDLDGNNPTYTITLHIMLNYVFEWNMYIENEIEECIPVSYTTISNNGINLNTLKLNSGEEISLSIKNTNDILQAKTSANDFALYDTTDLKYYPIIKFAIARNNYFTVADSQIVETISDIDYIYKTQTLTRGTSTANIGRTFTITAYIETNSGLIISHDYNFVLTE